MNNEEILHIDKLDATELFQTDRSQVSHPIMYKCNMGSQLYYLVMANSRAMAAYSIQGFQPKY